MQPSDHAKDSLATLVTDPLWRSEAYRLAIGAIDSGWDNITRLADDRRTRGVADQLSRALGSIGANIAEGFSRSSGRDRARFLEYALGSARESRTWYYQGRHVLGDETATDRMVALSSIAKLLLTSLPRERATTLTRAWDR